MGGKGVGMGGWGGEGVGSSLIPSLGTMYEVCVCVCVGGGGGGEHTCPWFAAPSPYSVTQILPESLYF